MTILENRSHQTCVLLFSVPIAILLLIPRPYGPISIIFSNPVKAIREHEDSSIVISAFNKSHSSTKSTIAFRASRSNQTQEVSRLQPPSETHVQISVPFIESIPSKSAYSTVQVNTGIIKRILLDVRVGLYSDLEASTRSKTRADKPKALSSRLLRIIPTIVLWITITAVVISILVAGILSVVYGGLPVPLSPQ